MHGDALALQAPSAAAATEHHDSWNPGRSSVNDDFTHALDHILHWCVGMLEPVGGQVPNAQPNLNDQCKGIDAEAILQALAHVSKGSSKLAVLTDPQACLSTGAVATVRLNLSIPNVLHSECPN